MRGETQAFMGEVKDFHDRISHAVAMGVKSLAADTAAEHSLRLTFQNRIQGFYDAQ